MLTFVNFIICAQISFTFYACTTCIKRLSSINDCVLWLTPSSVWIFLLFFTFCGISFWTFAWDSSSPWSLWKGKQLLLNYLSKIFSRIFKMEKSPINNWITLLILECNMYEPLYKTHTSISCQDSSNISLSSFSLMFFRDLFPSL